SVDDPSLARNYGFWSAAEQQALLSANVAVAGIGGDGYLLGLSLIRMGVGTLRVADPEVFELENVNRVPGAIHPNMGRPKVDCFFEDALAINPSLKLEVFPDGVTVGSIESFLDGVDLVIDETELTCLDVGTMIADQARLSGIPNLHALNIGFASQVMSFHPSKGPTFRDMIGVDETTSLEEVADANLDLRRILPFLPEYVDVEVLHAVNRGAPLPSIVQGVNLASALGTSQAFLHLVAGTEGSRRPEPVWYPEVLYVDSLTGLSKLSTDTTASFDLSLQVMEDNSANQRVTRLKYPLVSSID
ncbi:MAG: hypothetical protein GY773_24055, partial [Actinomycetia bacterium]|nr:hypothetical protein [Actinomycetes bacterium]